MWVRDVRRKEQMQTLKLYLPYLGTKANKQCLIPRISGVSTGLHQLPYLVLDLTAFFQPLSCS